MKKTKIIAGIASFAMIFGLGVNFISAEQADTFIYGDLNGDGVPEIDDLVEMSMVLLGDKTFNEMQKKAADVNGDGVFDIADLPTLKQYIMLDDIELGPAYKNKISQDDFDISKCRLLSLNAGYRSDYNLFNLQNKDQLSMLIDSQDKFTEFNEFWRNGYRELVNIIEEGFEISEDFFKENTLFIIARTEGNEAVKAGITDINLSEERGISFEITSDDSEDDLGMGIQIWLHAAVIPKKYLEGIDTSQIRIKNKGTAAENDSVLNYLDLPACDTLNYKTSGNCEFLRTDDNEFKMSAVIKSEEEFNNYNEKFDNKADKLSSYFGISEEFFKSNTLFVIPKNELYGNNKNEVTGIRINSDNKVCIEVTTSVPYVHTCDLATWHLAVAVPNKLIKGVDTTDFEITHIVNQQKDVTQDEVLDLSDCELIDCPPPYYYNINYQYTSYINQSLITSKEELYEYNSWLKFMTDIVRPYRDNWEEMLGDNVMVSIDCIGSSGMVDHSITGISVDENNKISVDLTIATPVGPLTCDYKMTHLCLLVPRQYLNKSSAAPTLEVIRHDVDRT